MNIIVSGMIAGTSGQGGASWAVLQYLLGLRLLGHAVRFVEPVDEAQADTSESARRCDEIMRAHGFSNHWCLVGRDGSTAGMTRRALCDVAARTDVLLNVSGMLTDEDVLTAVPVRAYLDLDPAFVQLWHSMEHIDMRLDAHTHFVTVSDAVGRSIPDCGRTWMPTLPPVVLDEWPFAAALGHDALTTVANWRGYGSIEHDGRHHGQKAHSWRSFFELPERVPERFVVALAIHADEETDLKALADHGWELVDPERVAGSPDAYRDFVQGSWAELGIAKSGYVVSDSGWFSDRSACYLASGRPVLAQDTGFGRRLPVGDGLLAITDADDVVDAVARLRADYDRHRTAARDVAEAHLDARHVLPRLLDAVLT